jgi:hypothetical protein
MTLAKLRTYQHLTSQDIRAIEAELRLIIAAQYPDTEPQATLAVMLRHLMRYPQATLEAAYASGAQTFGDTQFKLLPVAKTRSQSRTI